MSRHPVLLPVALVIGVAIHVDWHVGRSGHHLSLGLPYHWLLAVPVFAWAAWYVVHHRPDALVTASWTSIGAGVLLGQGAESLFEWVVYALPFSMSYGAPRLRVLMAFLASGIAAYLVTLALLRGRRPAPRPGA